MDSGRAAYDELYVYAMDRPGFILQHVVDAFAVQTASAETKPIKLLFALVGLYLRVERQFTGKEVQRAHMVLGRRRREWPRIDIPDERGSMTAADVLAAAPGSERDRAVDEWCRSLWAACDRSRERVIALLQEFGIV